MAYAANLVAITVLAADYVDVRELQMDQDFEQKIDIPLFRDEAIVLYWFLSREIWQKDQSRLKVSFENEAESHCLQALLQELIPKLIDTGGPDADQIHAAATEHLMGRHR